MTITQLFCAAIRFTGKFTLCTSFVLLLALISTSPCKAADNKLPPNIVFVLADDLGLSDVGFMGAKFYETPNIDRLAASGMIFTDAYTAGPNCMPTRASLMSGTYTPRHRHYTPGGKSKGKLSAMKLKVPAREGGSDYNTFESLVSCLPDSFVCIPEVLKKSGYVSARMGKWHLGECTQGFDISTSNGTDGPGGSHYGNINVAEKLTDAAVKFIEENQGDPFFLYLAHWDVHSPIRARKEVVAKYKEKLARTGGNWNPVYAAMIEAVDTSVGRLVETLDRLDLRRRTVFVFSSDNGGLPSVTTNAPLHGGKGSLFEGGIRVPTCVSWPGTVEAGSLSGAPITSVDFLPTFAEIADAKLPKKQPVDGCSIVPILRGAVTIDDRPIYWHYPLYLSGGQGNQVLPVAGTDKLYWRAVPSSAIRLGPWKLIHYFEDDTVKLFNVCDDISESNDLSTEMPEKVAELRAILSKWQTATGAPIPRELNPKFAP